MALRRKHCQLASSEAFSVGNFLSSHPGFQIVPIDASGYMAGLSGHRVPLVSFDIIAGYSLAALGHQAEIGWLPNAARSCFSSRYSQSCCFFPFSYFCGFNDGLSVRNTSQVGELAEKVAVAGDEEQRLADETPTRRRPHQDRLQLR